MSDALNDAIRQRERYEAALGDTGVAVYVVKIGHKTLNHIDVIGAVYREEAAAQAEVKRLNEANRHTRASYVERWTK